MFQATREHEQEEEEGSVNEKIAGDDECETTMAGLSASKSPKRKQRKVKNDESDKLFQKAVQIMKKPKDEYDRFGEYVASELKSLKFDINRGRLKSEIRKSIAKIADEDEGQFWSQSTSQSTSLSAASSPFPSSYTTTPAPSPCPSSYTSYTPTPAPSPDPPASQSLIYDSFSTTNYLNLNQANMSVAQLQDL